MTSTAFTLLFLPACLAVPAGLALGAVAEFLIERIGAAIMPSAAGATAPRPAPAGVVARPGRRADDEPRRPRGRDLAPGRPEPPADVAGGRRELAWFGLCGGLDAPARRDELALLNARRPGGPAPWM